DAIPAPIIKCLGKCLGLGLPIAPAFYLRGKIRKHIQDLGHADELLAEAAEGKYGGFDAITPYELHEACIMRGIDTAAPREELHRSLVEWLELTGSPPRDPESGTIFVPDRARVVALGLNIVSSVRHGHNGELSRAAVMGNW
ncbi:unnamed protein product, partial [Choristocarpus tenellus]